MIQRDDTGGDGNRGLHSRERGSPQQAGVESRKRQGRRRPREHTLKLLTASPGGGDPEGSRAAVGGEPVEGTLCLDLPLAGEIDHMLYCQIRAQRGG